MLARGVRHNEECRERIYEALRAAGAEKIQRADLEDSSRTATRTRKSRDPPEDPPPEEKLEDVPMPADAPSDPIDIQIETPHDDEPTVHEYQVDDTFDVHEEVDEDLGNDIEVD